MITSKIRRKAPYGAMYLVSQKEIQVQDGDSKKKKTVTVNKLVPNGRVDSRGMLMVLPIDQFSGRPFCLNTQGFPMNDIMIYENSQASSVAEAALRRIHILHPDNIDQSLTPDEMFERIVPANWSSPAEFVEASKIFASKWHAREQAKAAAAAADPEPSVDPIKFNDPNNLE